MPVARTHSIALVGVEGYPVEIETDIENGLPGLLLVGLPDTLCGRPATGSARPAGVDFDTAMSCLGALAAAGFVERCDRGWRLRRLQNDEIAQLGPVNE